MNRERMIIKNIVADNIKMILKGYFIYQLSSFFLIGSGLMIKMIFEKYEINDSHGVLIITMLFISLLLLRIIFIFINSIYSIKIKFANENYIRLKILTDVLSKSSISSVNLSVGDTLSVLTSDINQIVVFISKKYIELPSTIIFTATALIILTIINWRLLALTFLPLIFLSILVKHFGNLITKFHLANRNTARNVTTFIADIYRNFEVVKLLTDIKAIEDRFVFLNNERRKNALKDNLYSGLLNSGYKNIVMVGTGLSLLVLAMSSNDSKFVLSDFTIFIFYMGFITNSVEFFGEYFVNKKKISVAIANLENISHCIDLSSKLVHITKDKVKSNDNIKTFKSFELNNLSLSFNGSDNFLKKITFSVSKNETLVIVGKIGAGKTTLLRVLLGYLKSNEGELIINGDPKISSVSLVNQGIISYSPQVSNFFNTTIKDNIILNKEISDSDFMSLLDNVFIRTEIENMDDGCEHIVGANGVSLSGGQKQRVSIARMLACNAEVRLIDDITSAMDIETSRSVWNELLSTKNVTNIIVSNIKEVVKRADKIIILDNGEVKSIGKYEELIISCKEFQSLIV